MPSESSSSTLRSRQHFSTRSWTYRTPIATSPENLSPGVCMSASIVSSAEVTMPHAMRPNRGQESLVIVLNKQPYKTLKDDFDKLPLGCQTAQISSRA